MKRIDYHFLILLVIAIVAFLFHYISLSQTEYANGWDSYFYLLQVKSLYEDGYLVSSRISLIYPILLFFKWLSADYIIGWKVFVSTISACTVLLTYSLVKELTAQKKIALFSASIVLCSPHLFYFSSQYAKNLLGFDFFLLFLLFLFKRKFILAILFVFINLIVHKLTGVFAIITLGFFIGHQIFIKHKKHKLLLWSIIPIIALLFVPKIFGFDDLARQINLFTIKPEFGILHFFSDFKGLVSSIWKYEIVLVFIAAAIVVLLLVKKRIWSFNYWIIPILFIILNLPFLKWDRDGFTLRFFMFSILFGAIFGGIILSQFRNKMASYFLVCLLVGLTAISYRSYNPAIHDPKNYEYDKVINQLQNSGLLSLSKLTIAHKGLAEYIKFKTGKDAMSWIPEYQIHEDSLWRITADILTHRLKAVINSDDIFKLGYDYNAVKEKDWQAFLHHVKENNQDFYDDYTTWMNPNKIRPLFLQKYRRENDK